MTKVVLVLNNEESDVTEADDLSVVEVRGATGTATYRLDPMQDHTIKLVVATAEAALVTPEPEPVAEEKTTSKETPKVETTASKH